MLIDGKVTYRDRINKSADAAETGGVGAEIMAEKILPIASAEALLGAMPGAEPEEAPPGQLHIRLTPGHKNRLRPLYSALTSRWRPRRSPSTSPKATTLANPALPQRRRRREHGGLPP